MSTKKEEIVKLKEKDPNLLVRDIAYKVGCSRRYVRKILAKYTIKSKGVPLKIKVPKILLFDIETLPMEVLVWGLYEQRIPYDNVIKEWSIVSWAAKWLFDSNIMSDVVSPQAAKRREDKTIIKGIWDLLNDADIILAHNAIKFDVRKVNARFKVNGLPPTMPYQIIDTLKQSRKTMAFSSHRLDYLNKVLSKTQKIKTEYSLWKRCINLNNDLADQKKALKEMVAYNRQDIVALEELYVELRPWVSSHPNLGLYYSDAEGSVCPNCGSSNLIHPKDKYYYTPTGRYKAIRCKDCGAIARQRLTDVDKIEREKLIVSTAR